MCSVKISGFKTEKQALEFMKWYEGGGEQQFYDHLDCVEMSPNDGCIIDVSRKGNSGRYYDVNETPSGTEISAFIK